MRLKKLAIDVHVFTQKHREGVQLGRYGRHSDHAGSSLDTRPVDRMDLVAGPGGKESRRITPRGRFKKQPGRQRVENTPERHLCSFENRRKRQRSNEGGIKIESRGQV